MSEVKLLLGDSRELLKTLADNSLSCVICDPPYALVSIGKRFGKDGSAPAQFGTNGAYQRASAGFMGAKWDTGEVAFDPAFWNEVMRVIKPGGYLAAFGGSRSYHRLACAIEDAGWEIRDSIGYGHAPPILAWNYGSGFPKSHNISKSLDRMAGVEREVVGKRHEKYNTANGSTFGGSVPLAEHWNDLTVPSTDAAKEHEGKGTALKPSWEPICIARKPLSESSVAANCLRWGTGGINIDACRVGLNGEARPTGSGGPSLTVYEVGAIQPGRSGGNGGNETPEQGRWPPNVLLDSAMAQEMDKQSGQRPAGGKVKGHEPSHTGDNGIYGHFGRVENIPFTDSGGASRFFPILDYGPEDEQGWPDDVVPFFYTAKPAQSERNAGCDDLRQITPEEMTGRTAGSPGVGVSLTVSHNQSGTSGSARGNSHPTVKPVSVLKWLAALLCPPGGTILDPFAGSGSMGMAAINLNLGYIGMERETDYFRIGEARLKHAQGRTGLFADDEQEEAR